MPDATLLALAGGSLALGIPLGMAAAQIGAPISWNWRPRLSSIQLRLRCLPRGAPPVRLRAAGLALLAALLGGGALAAYAAEPSAPEALVKNLVGVTGSGDKLNLYVRQGGVLRRVQPGDVYADGWTLKALTNSEATLEKDGQTRRVGLNPTGALATAEAGPASAVTVSGQAADSALLARATERGVWDGVKLMAGLNLEQTRRFWILNEKFEIAYDAYAKDVGDKAVAAGQPRPSVGVEETDVLAALGSDAREYLQLENTWKLGRLDLAQAAFDRYGPVTANVANPLIAIDHTGPVAAYGPDALWKPVGGRLADGSYDVVLSPPALGDDHSLPLSAADNLGPFAPKVDFPTSRPAAAAPAT